MCVKTWTNYELVGFKLRLLKLAFINFRLTCSKLIESFKLLPFYLHPKLRKIDFYFFKEYLLVNPYRECRKYFKNAPEEVQSSYGETWASAISQWVYFLPITAEDIFYELGSGNGRISFWIQILSNCQVVGVEKVPLFIQKAKNIQEKMKNKKIQFLNQDILEVDYSKATLIYFYGTSFSDDMILTLLGKWKNLKLGTRVITTSFELNEYLDKPEYRVIRTFQEKYPWGKCDVYLQEKLSAAEAFS